MPYFSKKQNESGQNTKYCIDSTQANVQAASYNSNIQKF